MNLRFDPSIILLYIAASVERYLRCHTSGSTSPIPRNEGMPEQYDRSIPSDSKGLASAHARGFSEHPRRPKTAPASVPPEMYLQCWNRHHGPDREAPPSYAGW